MTNRIKVERAIHNPPQEDLANRISVSRKPTNAMEEKNYGQPTGWALKIARVFVNPVEKIFFREVKDKGSSEQLKVSSSQWVIPSGLYTL